MGPYVCEICSYKALTSYILKRHQSTHSSPTVPCTYCEKMFHNSVNLIRHLKTIHTEMKDQPFQCEECGKGFSVNITYKAHLNMHKGIKPYKCDYCGVEFQNGSNKVNHMKRMHR